MLSNAVALGSLSFNLSRVLGPAAAGVLIAGFGLHGCFLVQTVLMLVASLLTGLIRSGGDRSFASRRQSSLRNFTAGIQQVRLDPVLRGCVIVAVLQNLFGLTYSHLMPVFAEDVLSVGASGLGVLMTAVGLGSTAGAVAATALSTHRRKGFVLFATAVGYGLAIVAFSSTTWMPLALTALIALGASQAITQIATQTVLNLAVGNEYRGRVNSLFITTWSIGPAVALAAGWSADHVGAPLTVGACGLLTVISMLGAAAWLTELRRFAEQEPVFAMADTVPSPTDSG
jgi:MFS family permease